jgi:soluble lytic murein transglycosylase-like protein
LAETPYAAVGEEALTAGAELASVEVAAPTPSEPVDSVQDGIPETSTPPADLDADLLAVRASLVGRSGQRGAEESGLPSGAVAASDKKDNVQAIRAAAVVTPFGAVSSEMALEAVAKAPTTRLVVRPAVPTPRPVAATGSWVELPNVRPIPSTYYAAVHQWDSIVNYYAMYYHVDPDLIRRIIYVESKGYQYAYVASTGVKGLMQVTPSWFKAGENPYDPSTNIGRGTYILRRGYDTYHTWFLAVTWYCYGPLGRYGGSVPTFYAGLIYSPIIRSL